MPGVNFYLLGTQIDIVLEFQNLDGDRESPNDASITHVEPDGTETTYTEADPEFFEQAEGLFIYRHTPTQVGRQRYRGFSTSGLEVAHRHSLMIKE